MGNAKLVRFAQSSQVLACPLCGGALTQQDNSLNCENKHCFNIAKQGYAHLLGNPKQSAHYSKETFESRMRILEAGYYNHILKAVKQAVGERLDNGAQQEMRVLDVGCGEGFYARALHKEFGVDVVAFDISKDAVRMAAAHDSGTAIKWVVADLANIPVLDASINFIVDVFSPSNYAEFKRVLAKDGTLVKIIPGEKHLTELRSLAGDSLRNKEYSNQLVADRFEEFFNLDERWKISQTFDMPLEDIQTFAAMTPLLFGVDASTLDLSQLNGLTIEAEILIGSAKTN